MLDLIANFIETIIKYADREGLNRAEVFAEVAAFVCMVSERGTFKYYKLKED